MTRIGRPMKPVTDGEGQIGIGMRIPKALRAMLERAAWENHRTLSQEAERRLERSFDAKSLREDAAVLECIMKTDKSK